MSYTGWYFPPAMDEADNDGFLLTLSKGVAEIILKVEAEMDEIHSTESDEAYIERLERDIKAAYFNKIQDLVEGLF